MDHSIVSKTKQSRVSRRKVKAQGTRLHQAYLPQYWARNYRFTSNLLVHLKTDIPIYFFFHFGPFWSVQLGLGLCQFSIQFLLIQSSIWHLLVLSCPYSSCEKGIYADMHIFKKDWHTYKWNVLYYNMKKKEIEQFHGNGLTHILRKCCFM